MIDGLSSITTRTTGDDIEAGAGLDVSASDHDVASVSPRGRGYLVSAETRDGREISADALEIIPEPVLAGLREELDMAWPRSRAGCSAEVAIPPAPGATRPAPLPR